MDLKKLKKFLPLHIYLAVDLVVLLAPAAVLSVLAKHELVPNSSLSTIKIGMSIWNLFYLWVFSPIIGKKIDKLFEEKPKEGQTEALEQVKNELEIEKEDEKQDT